MDASRKELKKKIAQDLPMSAFHADLSEFIKWLDG
jgi:hypothetical protein